MYSLFRVYVFSHAIPRHHRGEALLLRRAKELSRCSLYEIVGYVLVRCRACYCVRKHKTTTGQQGHLIGILIRGKYKKITLRGFCQFLCQRITPVTVRVAVTAHHCSSVVIDR